MNRKRIIWHWISVALMAAAFLAFAASFFTGIGRGHIDGVARDLGAKVEKRMQVLDGYIEKALTGNPEDWMNLGDLPEDMPYFGAKMEQADLLVVMGQPQALFEELGGLAAL